MIEREHERGSYRSVIRIRVRTWSIKEGEWAEDTWLNTRWRCRACCTSSASTTPDCPLLFAFTWSLRSCLMRAVSSFLAARITLKDCVHHVCAFMLVCE